eukprot:1157453-Pelagomonas_calceolata.AAC.1
MDFDDLFRDKPGAYGPWEAYGQSKRANILFTYELACRLQAHPQVSLSCRLSGQHEMHPFLFVFSGL